MEERRKYVRLDASIKVEYKVLKDAKAKREVISKNISGGGVCFSVKEGLKSKTILEMEIGIPDGAEPICAKGEVVWLQGLPISQEARRKYFEVGVKFIRIASLDRDRILNYVYNQIHRLIYDEVGKIIKELKES